MSDADWNGIEQFREEARALAEEPFLRAEQLAAERDVARNRVAALEKNGAELLARAEAAERDLADSERIRAKLKQTIDAFPDARDAANLAHARAERDRLRARLTGVAIHANRARNCIWPETPAGDALADLFATLEAPPGGES